VVRVTLVDAVNEGIADDHVRRRVPQRRRRLTSSQVATSGGRARREQGALQKAAAIDLERQAHRLQSSLVR